MSAARHLVLGLTGNMGAGKSTVAAMLRQLGARTVDSDTTVRRLLDNDDELRAEIRAAFGDAVFVGTRLDRSALAELVFGNARALRRLEDLVHPRVGRETQRLLREPTEATTVTVLEAIKVVEGPNCELLDALWVVDAPAPLLVRRVVAAGRLTETQVRARLGAQSSMEEKIQIFRDRRPGKPVWRIGNQESLDELRARVAAAWEELAKSSTPRR